MIRIFEEKELNIGRTIITEKVNYLANVMRKKLADEIIVVNGSNREFVGKITRISKREIEVLIVKQTRETICSDFLGLIFSPIHKIDLLLKSATELGITEFISFKSQYQQVKFNIERVKANVIEAIEQSERLDFPTINKEDSLQNILENLNKHEGINVFFCEERNENDFNLRDLNLKRNIKIIFWLAARVVSLMKKKIL